MGRAIGFHVRSWIRRAQYLPLVFGAALVLGLVASTAEAQERAPADQQPNRSQDPEPRAQPDPAQEQPQPQAQPQPREEPQPRAQVQPPADEGADPSAADSMDDDFVYDAAVALPAVALAGLWVVHPLTKQITHASKQGTEWRWPVVYDLQPLTVRLVWVAQPPLEETLAAFGAGARTQATLELTINNHKLDPSTDYTMSLDTGPPCPQGRKCLMTIVRGTSWFRSESPWWLELALREPARSPEISLQRAGPPVSRIPIESRVRNPNLLGRAGIRAGQENGAFTAQARVKRSGPATSYFAEKIFPAFQHDRCTACHALGSVAALESLHAPVDFYPSTLGDGKVSAEPIMVQQTGHGSVLTCSGGCHNMVQYSVPGKTFTEVEWKAPGSDMHIDWRGKNAKYICSQVKTRLPSAEALANHFHDDARIGWAVHSGVLPPVGPNAGKQLPLAPPGSYAEWASLTGTWILFGAPCPH